MNLLQAHPSSVLRSLPSSRTLALMALLVQAPEPRVDQCRAGYEPVEPDANTGAGWFESSFELGRGLLVLEGLPGEADQNHHAV